MKTKNLLVSLALMLALVILPLDIIVGQVTVFGNAGAGVQMRNGQTSVPAMYGGVDLSLFSDSSSGLRWVSRTMYYYADYGDERDVQAVNEWIWQTKSLRFLGAAWYAGLGIGYLWEIEQEDDQSGVGLGFDFGVDLHKSFSAGITGMWQPIDEEPDPVALMFKVDLSP